MKSKNTQTAPQNEHAILQARVVRVNQLKWSLPFLAAFLPIVLLSVYSFQIASDSVESLVQEENISGAGNLAQLFVQDVRQNVKLAHAIASIPGTISAVQSKNQLTVRTRLKAVMVSNPHVHRAFVVDTNGELWSEFPTAEGAYGTNFSDWRWFHSVQQHRTPYISGLYIRPQFPDQPVVAIAVPIQSRQEFLGVLVFEYQVKHISQWLANVRLGISGHMLLVDQYASLVAHPFADVGGALAKQYVGIKEIDTALTGVMHTDEYRDPETQKIMIASFIPIAMGENMWVAIAQQPKSEAFAILDQVKKNLTLVGSILTLFTLIMVSALARMSAKVAKLNLELESKNQAIKDFTSIVSHQLKAPITAMRWNLEMILDGDYGAISPKLREILLELAMVNTSNYHLVLDILNVSRLDRGVVAVDRAPMTLGEIADRAARDYEHAAQKAGLYLKIEGNRAIIVMADLEKTAESVTNAISNAIKYTPKGGITITLSKKDQMGVIEVIDTGKGMDKKILEKLFSRDGVKKSNSGAESSSGLGLYIAKNFMQMQGGDIAVTSAVGKGTTFRYTLKLASGEEIATSVRKESEESEESEETEDGLQ